MIIMISSYICPDIGHDIIIGEKLKFHFCDYIDELDIFFVVVGQNEHVIHLI